ncbi:MAG: murein hydrolase activator EnvC family protein, partial [Spirochaetota bacterium]
DGVKSIGIVIQTQGRSPVYCAENGVIKKIGYMRGYGNYVVVVHSSRFMTVYANLGAVAVKDGQHIRKGNVIGTLESTDGHLHFQINHAGKPLDALAILPKR